MLRSHYDCSSTKNSVDTSRKHSNFLIAILDGEIDVGAFTAANPIALTLQNFLGPCRLDLIHLPDELLGIGHRAQEPLFQIPLFNRSATAPTNSSGRLFIRKYSAFVRTPIDRRV